MIIILFTIVITNPYDNLDYNKINVYDFNDTYLENCIHVTDPEQPEEDTSGTFYDQTKTWSDTLDY